MADPPRETFIDHIRRLQARADGSAVCITPAAAFRVDGDALAIHVDGRTLRVPLAQVHEDGVTGPAHAVDREALAGWRPGGAASVVRPYVEPDHDGRERVAGIVHYCGPTSYLWIAYGPDGRTLLGSDYATDLFAGMLAADVALALPPATSRLPQGRVTSDATAWTPTTTPRTFRAPAQVVPPEALQQLVGTTVADERRGGMAGGPITTPPPAGRMLARTVEAEPMARPAQNALASSRQICTCDPGDDYMGFSYNTRLCPKHGVR